MGVKREKLVMNAMNEFIVLFSAFDMFDIFQGDHVLNFHEIFRILFLSLKVTPNMSGMLCQNFTPARWLPHNRGG